MGSCMHRFCQISCRLERVFQSSLLLLFRLIWGSLFLMTGWHKLTHLAETAEFFQQLNLPVPLVNSLLVGCCEAIGGALLVIGYKSRLSTLPLIVIMLTAYFTAHASSLGTLQEIMQQPPFNYLLTCLLVLAFGPGMFSLDAFLGRCQDKVSKSTD